MLTHLRTVRSATARQTAGRNPGGSRRPGRRLGLAAVAALLMLCLGALNATAADIVIVKTSDAAPYQQAEEALRAKLAEQHHTVRTTLVKEVSEQGIAVGIGQADVVVAVGTPAASWLHKQLPPAARLCYCMVTNADAAGLLQGNPACGVTTDVPVAVQIKLIAETLPQARAIGMLYRSDTPAGQAQLQSLKAVLPADWRLEAVAVNDHASVANAIDAMFQRNIDIVWTAADQTLYDTAAVRALLLAAIRGKVPVWGFSPAFVRAGALVGVGVEPRAQGAQAAQIVLSLLANPAAPAGRALAPEEYQIAVNLVVAAQIGVEIPDSLTRRASYVFREDK